MVFVLLLILLLPCVSAAEEIVTEIVPARETIQLADGLSAVRFDGDDYFDDFLARGGADSDAGVITFLAGKLLFGQEDLCLNSGSFACSAASVSSPDGDALFGRNFDWRSCNALIVESHPKGSYASVSTANLDFLSAASMLPESALTLASLYASLDGMNEKGLCVAVLYIQGIAPESQNLGRPDLTTTTAVRLLLNKAADVDEAVALLEQYDFHSSLGMTVHFALSDAGGRSVAVEYIGGELKITETPVVTNFVLADCSQYGIGTAQSMTRYELLSEDLDHTPLMDEKTLRTAMQSVDKSHWDDGEETEWTMICSKKKGTVTYYHRQDYTRGWLFRLK